jgi:Flp pilus assembly protein TadD
MSLLVGVALTTSLTGCASNQSRLDAEAEALAAEEAKENDPRVLAAVADEAWRFGAIKTAVFNYNKVLELEPENIGVRYRLAVLEQMENHDREALAQYDEILALRPDHSGALEGSGLILLEQRKSDEAQHRLGDSVQLDPRRWRAHNGLGILADLRGDYLSATEHYANALEMNPDSAMLANNLGYSQYLAGDLVGAEKAFRVALQVNPKYERAWKNLGLVQMRNRSYRDSVISFSHAMKRYQAYNTVGYLCLLEERYDDAERFLLQAAELSPVYYELAYENLERVEDARRDNLKKEVGPG